MKWYDYTLTAVAIVLTVAILTRPETNIITVPIECGMVCVAQLPNGVVTFDVTELEQSKVAIRTEFEQWNKRVRFEVAK